MSTIVELNAIDLATVAGGSIIDEIEDRHPGGVWVGNQYFPNGVPEEPFNIPVY